MAFPQTTDDAFDIGRVVRRTFKLLGENLALVTAGALLLTGAPRFLAMLGGDALFAPRSGSAFWLSLTGTLLGAVGGVFLQGMIIYVSANDRDARDARAVGAVFVAAKVFPRMWRLGLLTFVGVAIGLVLLVVPGLLLGVVWIVAAPVLVIERCGVIQSLQRSRDLTRGFRGRIVALLAAYGVVAIVISLLAQGLGLVLVRAFVAGAGGNLASLLLSSLVSASQGVVALAGAAAIYSELRAVKEGA